jgi:hypothetical protein
MAATKQPLSVTHPEVAAQAHGWDPTTITAGSGKKVEWKCKFGHTWNCSVSDRSSGNGCPICSGRMAWAGHNDLATTNPELAAQAHGWDPTTITANSNKKVEWKCKFGHTWMSSINNRSNGRGCPICSNTTVLAGFNDLATTHPELAAQAHGWDPTTITAGSSKKVEWICKLNHVWNTTAYSRNAGSGCPYCSGKKALIGINDLATTHPELAAQAHGWDPTTLKAGSEQKVSWVCGESHIWQTSIANRVRADGNSCPTCRGQRTLSGFNDLATTNPELAAQAHGWDPTTITAKTKTNSHRPWICQLGHVWKASLHNRISGTSCPICSNTTVLAGFNDLATTNPELAAQAHGWDPTTLTAFSNKKVGWKCNVGHMWIAALNARSRGSGCPTCSGKTVEIGFNDLRTTHPELATEADGWDPTTVTAGSGKKMAWKCRKGHTWKAAIGDRTRLSSTSCPTCSKYGFDPSRDAWLYLIDHDELRMFQIGISNFLETRIGQHSKRGWEVIEVRGPMEGHLAQELETAILHAIERRGAILGHKAQIDKFDGYSEAWMKDSLMVTDFKQILAWVYKDDQSVIHTD